MGRRSQPNTRVTVRLQQQRCCELTVEFSFFRFDKAASNNIIIINVKSR